MWKRLALLLWLGIWTAIAATAEPTPILVASITLAPPEGQDATAQIGRTLPITATIEPGNADNTTLLWESDAPEIAQVDENGLVTGVALGTARITARATDGSDVSGFIDVRVEPVYIERIELSLSTKSLTFGVKWPITATVYPRDATTPDIVWSTTNAQVATVEGEGLNVFMKTGNGQGVVGIDAIAADGSGVVARCILFVRNPVTDVLLASPNERQEINKGQSMDVSASVLPFDASQEIEWTCDDPKVGYLEVSEDGAKCVFYGVGGGRASVRATAQDGSGTSGEMGIDVQVPLVSIALPEEAHVFIERSSLIAPVYEPEDTTYRTLRWSSSDPSILTVDSGGTIWGLRGVHAYVTAQAAADSDIVGRCLVSVTKPVRTIALQTSDRIIGVSGKTAVSAAVSPNDAHDRSLVWSSSDESVAVVDEYGVVTGVATGKTVISAAAADGGGAAGFLSIEVVATPTGISLPTRMSAIPGQSFVLKAVASPAGVDPGKLTWTSEDSTVATVDDSGLVVGLRVGQTVICAKTQGGLEARCAVTIETKLLGVVVRAEGGLVPEEETLEINLGERVNFTAQARPLGLDANIAFSVNQPDIASVTRDGTFLAKNLGVVTLRVLAVTSAQRMTRSVKIRVIQPVTSILLPEKIGVLRGGTQKVTAAIAPKKATHRELTWVAGDSTIASVNDKGVVTGCKPGETLLTATAHNGVVSVCRVRVTEPAASIELTAPTGRINPGDAITVEAKVSPAQANQAVLWKSGNPAVARVDSSGHVTIRKAGQARITARAADGSGVTASLVISVIPRVKKLVLNKTQITLYTNGSGKKLPASFRLQAKPVPAYPVERAIVYQTNDPLIATVDETGLVEAVSDGVCVISAGTENDAAAQMLVQVRTLPTTITLQSAEIELTVGERFDLSRDLVMDGSEPALTWSSDKRAVAAVTKAGVVKAKKPGKAVVRVTAKGGATASCTVRVNAG